MDVEEWYAASKKQELHSVEKMQIKKDENYERPLTRQEEAMLRNMLKEKLVQDDEELKIQQRDPSSPLYSVKSFYDLHLPPRLLQGIFTKMGFNKPSKIQETALPLLLANPPENMIAQSQSGTGKTAAFVLTMLSRIDWDKKYPQCMCLVPTYELALQTGRVVERMGHFLPNLQVGYAVRGHKVPRNAQITAQIVIGTPGTTLDWTRHKAFELSKIIVFVLDEADVMIDTQGFKDQSIRLHRQLSKQCQLLLFSATYDDDVMQFAQRVICQPNMIRLRRDEETLDNIKQYHVICGDVKQKYQSLIDLYSTLSVGQAIIFCQTRVTATWLAKKMCKEGFLVALLTGELDITQRAAILRRFKEAKERVLVTTNVCSRGIDVRQINLVVNFDLPVGCYKGADSKTYLHRIGRTGRFGKSGVAINFVSNEKDMSLLKEIEEHFGINIERLDTSDYVDMQGKLGDG